MIPASLILWTIALVILGMLATGYWRLAFHAVAIRASRMTVERLGLTVTEPEDIVRVNGILQSFAGGFNAMIRGRTDTAWHRYVDALSPLKTGSGAVASFQPPSALAPAGRSSSSHTSSSVSVTLPSAPSSGSL